MSAFALHRSWKQKAELVRIMAEHRGTSDKSVKMLLEVVDAMFERVRDLEKQLQESEAERSSREEREAKVKIKEAADRIAFLELECKSLTDQLDDMNQGTSESCSVSSSAVNTPRNNVRRSRKPRYSTNSLSSVDRFPAEDTPEPRVFTYQHTCEQCKASPPTSTSSLPIPPPPPSPVTESGKKRRSCKRIRCTVCSKFEYL